MQSSSSGDLKPELPILCNYAVRLTKYQQSILICPIYLASFIAWFHMYSKHIGKGTCQEENLLYERFCCRNRGDYIAHHYQFDTITFIHYKQNTLLRKIKIYSIEDSKAETKPPSVSCNVGNESDHLQLLIIEKQLHWDTAFYYFSQKI